MPFSLLIKLKNIYIHSPHLSLLAHSGAIDSQLSGSYDSACLQIQQLLSKVPCAIASYKAFLRPSSAKTVHLFPVVLTDRWQLEHKSNAEGCMAPRLFQNYVPDCSAHGLCRGLGTFPAGRNQTLKLWLHHAFDLQSWTVTCLPYHQISRACHCHRNKSSSRLQEKQIL